MCFFDYEKAFDKVWREGLLFKMVRMGTPSRYLKYTRQFLSGRKTKVQINGVNSREFYLNEGLPQGTSILPLLIIIYINDIDDGIEAEFTLFADDTAAWIGGDRRRKHGEKNAGGDKWSQRLGKEVEDEDQ